MSTVLRMIESNKRVSNATVSSCMRTLVYGAYATFLTSTAYDMIEEGPERHRFRRSIANRLYRMSKDKRLGRDWMVYAAADHFNGTPQADSLFLAKVNLEAGRRCIRSASFGVASKYLTHAMDHLKGTRDVWDYHYKLALQIYAKKVEADALSGNMKEARLVSDVLFKKAKSSNDTLRARVSMARALGRKESHVEAFEMSRKALRSLGLYPKSRVGLIGGLVRDMMYLRTYFKKNSDGDVLSLPRNENEHFHTVIDLFLVVGYQAFFAGHPLDFIAMTLKCNCYTLKHGLCASSGRAIMAYGLVCDALDDRDQVVRLSKLGLAILDKFDDKTQLCLSMIVKLSCVDSWNVRAQPFLEECRMAHNAGMEFGDFENAAVANALLLDHQYSLGYSLALLDVQYANLVAREKLMHIGPYQKATKCLWEPIRLLRGTADDLSKRQSCLPFKDSMKALNFSRFGKDDTTKAYHYRGLLQIGVYWNDHDFLEKLLEIRLDVPDKGHFQIGIRLCFLAIAYGTLYQQGSKRKKLYLRRARKCVAELKATSEKKGMISWHRQVLAGVHLDAISDKKCFSNSDGEQSSSLSSMVQQYEMAMELAVNRKQFQDAGLGAQLLVQQLLWKCDRPDLQLVGKYLGMARRWYKDWGATNLIRHLDQKYENYALEQESEPFSVPTSVVPTAEDKLRTSERSLAPNLDSVVVTEKTRDDCSTVTDTNQPLN